MTNKQYKPTVLIIRDGWGENHNPQQDKFNAVKLAKTPISDKLRTEYPTTEITACGPDVGLPEGVMGNSEVGHQNIGAGRIVDQEIRRIDKAFKEGTLAENPTLKKAFEHVRANDSKLHFMGLASSTGVHSVLRHLYGLMDLAKKAGIKEVFIHAFTDGRDSPPYKGIEFIKEIENKCQELGLGKIASVSGRYWAMDRDKRWDRTEKAYNCLIGKNPISTATSAEEAIQNYYDHPSGETLKGDEFITPTIITDKTEQPVGAIEKGDSVVFFNFRGDRPRQLTQAFIDKDFDGFKRTQIENLFFATLTNYEEGLCENVILNKPKKMVHILGEIISEKGLKQFRCAETEKYPHVTFFFNDYREEPFPGEERELIPSPRDISTYDQKPEMSAYGVCEATKKAILSQQYALIVVNFANADMVGHTGSLPAAIKAVEVVDECLGCLMEAIDKVDGSALITADHGNADQMWNPETNSPHTQHTLNPVQVILYGKDCKKLELRDGGRLADIAPTLLQLLHIPQPKEMTGESLIIK